VWQPQRLVGAVRGLAKEPRDADHRHWCSLGNQEFPSWMIYLGASERPMDSYLSTYNLPKVERGKIGRYRPDRHSIAKEGHSITLKMVRFEVESVGPYNQDHNKRGLPHQSASFSMPSSNVRCSETKNGSSRCICSVVVAPLFVTAQV
jgi:hypothetical protein